MNESLKKALFEYCLWLGDNSLISGQRLSEWCGHGPMLEEDIALTNIALDLIGQARTILDYAAQLETPKRTADELAFYRDARQFRNSLLVEYPNTDFAFTILKQYLMSEFNLLLYDKLKTSSDSFLSGFAAKSEKEVIYHLRHSRDWMLRLGGGTDESNTKLKNAVEELWLYTDDLFCTTDEEAQLVEAKIIPDISVMKEAWKSKVAITFEQSNLMIPTSNNFMRTGGRKGLHTEHLGYILAEMQFLPRAYPGAKWD